MRMQTSVPAQKVTVATAAAAIVQLSVGISEVYLNKPVPTAISGPITTLVVFIAGYITQPAKRDQIKIQSDSHDGMQ
ncbi:hypothetical protein [Mastigocoleus testarum]|uniref:Uncharacterized protein n=1 Tax=Mastigocoleus testarum BC008 TaxID=371196 RepID=A0A0V7ZWK4_9CYAN|nr:hypothetical protein [Mastigocoleus testarum]KST69012.1 hypothetical protein BC008_02800 [Mastigocoleus testarum BC008]